VLIIGIDEAGYGAIAGPLVVAAVAYEKDQDQPSREVDGKTLWVQDSKKVRPEFFPQLDECVRESARVFEVHTFSSADIDRMGGPFEAKVAGLTLVARRMVERLHVSNSETREATIIVDGHITLDLPLPYQAIPKADQIIWQVGAASILAKYQQLLAMAEAHDRYSRYAFKHNKGYPTEDHLERLERHGPCKLHRRSTRSLAPWRKKPKGRE
jgi:ribonuclease HII